MVLSYILLKSTDESWSLLISFSSASLLSCIPLSLCFFSSSVEESINCFFSFSKSSREHFWLPSVCFLSSRQMSEPTSKHIKTKIEGKYIINRNPKVLNVNWTIERGFNLWIRRHKYRHYLLLISLKAKILFW